MSLSGLKRLLVGKSLPASSHAEERLSNAAALAVLSSDALSSVAYATQAILLVLVAAGSAALSNSIPIAVTIMLLLGIVILSYGQTIEAYPTGGGSYIVARENYRHYKYVAERLSIQDLARGYIPRPRSQIVTHPAIVIIGQFNRGTVEALDYARSIADEIIAVYVDIGSTDREKLRRRWAEFESDIHLEIIDSPFRSSIEPIVDFISDYERQHPDVLSTIIIPAFVTKNWWEGLLHNQTTLFLKAALLGKRSRVVTTVRYYP